MGTPDFAEKSLEAIYNAKHEIIAVVTKQADILYHTAAMYYLH